MEVPDENYRHPSRRMSDQVPLVIMLFILFSTSALWQEGSVGPVLDICTDTPLAQHPNASLFVVEVITANGCTYEEAIPLSSGVNEFSFVVQPGDQVSAVRFEGPMIGARILTDEGYDFSSTERLVASMESVISEQSDLQVALELWYLMQTYFMHAGPPTGDAAFHDPAFAISAFGYGLCDDSAYIIQNLATLAGLEARVWALSGHLIPEVDIDGGGHMIIDADAGWWINETDDFGDAEYLINASVADVIADSSLLKSSNPSYDDLVWSLYASTEDNSVHKQTPPSYDMSLVLGRDDFVRLSLEPGLEWVTGGEIIAYNGSHRDNLNWSFTDTINNWKTHEAWMARTVGSGQTSLVHPGNYTVLAYENGVSQFQFNRKVLPSISEGLNEWVIVVDSIPSTN
jgi:hypothetical protein